MSERTLYLAVPGETFLGFFQERDVQEILETHRIRLLVFDPHSEEIIQWIE